MNPNNQYAPAKTFGKQHVLNHAPRNLEEEAAALRYLDQFVPDPGGHDHGSPPLSFAYTVTLNHCQDTVIQGKVGSLRKVQK